MWWYLRWAPKVRLVFEMPWQSIHFKLRLKCLDSTWLVMFECDLWVLPQALQTYKPSWDLGPKKDLTWSSRTAIKWKKMLKKCILCHGISKTRPTFGTHLKYPHKDQTLHSGMKNKQFYTTDDIDRTRTAITWKIWDYTYIRHWNHLLMEICNLNNELMDQEGLQNFEHFWDV